MSDRTTGLFLRRTEENVAAVDALARACGGRVGLGVLDDLNRRAHRAWAPGRAVDVALRWDLADQRDRSWWPQGISSSLRTDAHRDVLAVAWYRKREDGRNDGVRVTFLDPVTRHYRHVLLVTPVVVDGRVEVRPVRAHAGGLVWHGPNLHVAATARGFLSCRLADLVRVPSALESSLESSLDHRGHRYLLPVRFEHRATADAGIDRLRYSFLTLDRSSTSLALVAGEYGSLRQTRRLVRIPLDPATELPDAGAPITLLGEGLMPRLQGVAVADGTLYLTSSHGRWRRGSVWVGEGSVFREYADATPMGPEDLVWWPETDLLWCATEHPWRRWVVGMRRSRFSPVE